MSDAASSRDCRSRADVDVSKPRAPHAYDLTSTKREDRLVGISRASRSGGSAGVGHASASSSPAIGQATVKSGVIGPGGVA